MAAINISGGARIGLFEMGGGEATPIVFLHGVGSDKSVWARQVAHFGRARRAIAFDYPGYGESSFVEGATRAEFAAAIWSGLDALGISSAHVCGLSLGGIIAMEMYALAPDRCSSLILADTFARHPDGQAIYDRSRRGADEIGMAMLAQQRAPMLLGSGSSQLLPEVIATMSRINPAAYRLGAAAVWLAEERVRASTIAVPSLVICGAEDTITPPALSEELAALIPGSRIAMIPAAGHLSNLERPAEFNETVDDFLAEIEGGR